MNFGLVILHWALDDRERVDSDPLPTLAVVERLAFVPVAAYCAGPVDLEPPAKLAARFLAY